MGSNIKITNELEEYINNHSYKLNPIQREIIKYNKTLGEKKKMQISLSQCHLLHLIIKLYNPKNSKISYNLMQGPWINFSKKGEFNPMHNHSGKISAIIFIDVPDELEQERDKSSYSMKSSASLEFIFGNQHTIINPKTGMMYLFPSHLWHLVYPFNSDVERISMSFNVDNLFVDDKRIEMDYDVDWLVEE